MKTSSRSQHLHKKRHFLDLLAEYYALFPQIVQFANFNLLIKRDSSRRRQIIRNARPGKLRINVSAKLPMQRLPDTLIKGLRVSTYPTETSCCHEMIIGIRPYYGRVEIGGNWILSVI